MNQPAKAVSAVPQPTRTENIYQRVNRVMQAVEYVQKDATVQTGGERGYKAVTHDMVLAVLRKAMVENGIVTVPALKSHELVYTRGADPKGNKEHYSQHLYQAVFVVRFVNADNPQDFIETEVPAHANDSGDKAPGKAMSYAVKYAMLKVFGLETGESDEGRMYEPPQYTELQLEEFNTLLDQRNAIGFAVFARKVGPDVMIALSRSFPDGKVSQGKKLCKDLESEGWDKLRQYADEIKVATDKEDITYLAQMAAELNADEKRVLSGILRPEDIDALRKARDIV